MECLQRVGWSFSNSIRGPLKPKITVLVNCSSRREDVLETFVRERQLSGDLVSKLSDIIWERRNPLLKIPHQPQPQPQPQNQVTLVEEEDKVTEDGDIIDNEGGFLKLSATQEWLSGSTDSAPRNKKAIAKALQDDRERRQRLNLLKYEAIKRELLVLSIGIGTACTAYCLIVLSVQAAVSYATGVFFSCVYLELLCNHVDKLRREDVPQIFRQKKKTKKIGIRSEDLQNSIERTIRGSGMALSSPRLVIPAVIYAVWILCHRYISSEFFDFQIVPAMLGMFVYKAAALVQLYRDNQDLTFVFPQNEL